MQNLRIYACTYEYMHILCKCVSWPIICGVYRLCLYLAYIIKYTSEWKIYPNMCYIYYNIYRTLNGLIYTFTHICILPALPINPSNSLVLRGPKGLLLPRLQRKCVAPRFLQLCKVTIHGRVKSVRIIGKLVLSSFLFTSAGHASVTSEIEVVDHDQIVVQHSKFF